MSPPTFLERYDTEVPCRDALMRMCREANPCSGRWLSRFRCPHCGHAGHCQLRGRPVLQCNRCQASLTAGTPEQFLSDMAVRGRVDWPQNLQCGRAGRTAWTGQQSTSFTRLLRGVMRISLQMKISDSALRFIGHF